jgi:hypothetical protein
VRRSPQRIGLVCALFVSVVAGKAWAQAQESQGPIAPPPKFEAKRVPTAATPAAPPIPSDEIIRRFSANEDVMKNAYNHYTFAQTVRVQELADPGGDFTVTGVFYTKPDGQRYERITKPPASTLKLTTFSLEDVKTIASLPFFILTTDQLTHYRLEYVGKDKLDELNTYIFRVQPKQVERTHRYFDGVVWVDDQDFAIVKSSGQFVSEISGDGTELPFKMYDTYRENFDGKYWFPTYTSSDDYSSNPKGKQLHLRLVIRSTDFKPETSAGIGANQSPPPSLKQPSAPSGNQVPPH